MSFKENLLRKIEIKRLSESVIRSFEAIPSEDGPLKADRDAMRKLITTNGFSARFERDLELYILDGNAGRGRIFVLDNEMPIYLTALEDVLLRKSPTIKEMVNICNAVKILRDQDVVISKKAASVEIIRDFCIGRLDLGMTMADLDEIEREGLAALEKRYAEGVVECLGLFSELLGYTVAPNALKIKHFEIMGRAALNEKGEQTAGPLVLYSLIQNELMLVEGPISASSKEQVRLLHEIAAGNQEPAQKGPDVLHHLKRASSLLIR
jgi:hypothetical protein